MTVIKCAAVPASDQYGGIDGEEVVSVKLDGGPSWYRRDILNANATIDVTWVCDHDRWQYLRAFYNTTTLRGSLPFLIDLFLDQPTLTEHTAYFEPGSFKLSYKRGRHYIVTAKIEVVPVTPDAAVDAALVRASQTLALDMISTVPTGAYSFRKLRASYTGAACRVRESGGNTEQDIGFVGTELDTEELLFFVGANNGFVTKVYDQSGNTRDWAQATAADQLKLVNAGALITTIGGKPCMQSAGTPQYMTCTATLSSLISGTAYCAFSLVRPSTMGFADSSGWARRGIISDTSQTFYQSVGSSTFILGHLSSGSVTREVTVAATVNNTYVAMHRYDAVAIKGVLNGGTGTSLVVTAAPTPLAGTMRPFTTNTAHVVADNAFIGEWSEHICFNVVPSLADQNTIGAAMAARGAVTWTAIS
ncbi:MAG: hypothetical protein Q7N50_10860 [Armatimonadota bacterium]|nr:hypothetical protein [Armatimonadota bacterium]